MSRGKRYDLLSDRELVAITLEGDQKGFSALIKRHRNPLLKFILGFSVLIQDAEDICQESFRKAYSSLSSYDSKYAFSTWLYSIAENTTKDHLRKHSTIQSLNRSNNSTDELRDAPFTVSSPEETMIENQTYQTLISLIESLDPIYKGVAELRFIKEYAYEEIASELGLELNTVKTRVRRAKAILSQKIKI